MLRDRSCQFSMAYDLSVDIHAFEKRRTSSTNRLFNASTVADIDPWPVMSYFVNIAE